MKRIALLSAVLLAAALPAFAASPSFELTGWASWVNANSSTAFNSSAPNQPFGISLHNKVGWGAGANIFWFHNISTAFSVIEVRPSSRFVNTATGTVTGPNLRMTPITGIVQFHFAPAGFVDPYVGAGAAYVLFDNVAGPANLGVNHIHFRNDAGFVINAGAQFGLARNLAITVDGKYVPLHAATTAVYTAGANVNSRFKINPAIFSAGLTFRF